MGILKKVHMTIHNMLHTNIQQLAPIVNYALSFDLASSIYYHCDIVKLQHSPPQATHHSRPLAGRPCPYDRTLLHRCRSQPRPGSSSQHPSAGYVYHRSCACRHSFRHWTRSRCCPTGRYGSAWCAFPRRSVAGSSEAWHLIWSCRSRAGRRGRQGRLEKRMRFQLISNRFQCFMH